LYSLSQALVAGQIPPPVFTRKGRSQREIERLTGVDRKTIRRYEQGTAEGGAPGHIPPGWPPALTAEKASF
jgi:hypothetical protein